MNISTKTGFVRTLRSNFSPLKIANFRNYLAGQAVSLIGTWLQLTAQGWVVWELSHSEAALGVVAMLGTLPILLLALWVYVDEMRGKNLWFDEAIEFRVAHRPRAAPRKPEMRRLPR